MSFDPRAEVYVLEATIALLVADIEGWRSGQFPNDPVPKEGQLKCANFSEALVAELRGRLELAKQDAARRGLALWDPLATPEVLLS